MTKEWKERINLSLLILAVWLICVVFMSRSRKADYRAIDASPVVRINLKGKVEVKQGASVEQYKLCITELANEVIRLNKQKEK